MTIKHPDGTLHQVCGECGTDAGQVMRSGYGGSPDGPCGSPESYVDIVPEHPVFWDPMAERGWFYLYIARQRVVGAYVSPEVLAKAAGV
jgi:hypothetical protein